MKFFLPIYQDLNDYFAVRTKTLSRIAIADIMDNNMLIRWYSKIFDSYLLVKDLKGFGLDSGGVWLPDRHHGGVCPAHHLVERVNQLILLGRRQK